MGNWSEWGEEFTQPWQGSRQGGGGANRWRSDTHSHTTRAGGGINRCSDTHCNITHNDEVIMRLGSDTHSHNTHTLSLVE